MTDAAGLDDAPIHRVLLAWRVRLSAAAWLATGDSLAAEDILQAAAVEAISSGARVDADGG